jgi:isopentenyl diphosphate isomerase/L-lactate dehydrogenase-like FMN-dependent dehydrogenase
VFAPISIHIIYHPKGEILVATVAAQLHFLYSLSTVGSSTIEDVDAANYAGRNEPDAIRIDGADNDSSVRFFQLHLRHDDELAFSLLRRAVDDGFTDRIVTIDTWQLGSHHDNDATPNLAFYRGIGADSGLADPVFQKRFTEVDIDSKIQLEEAGAAWMDNAWHGRSFS